MFDIYGTIDVKGQSIEIDKLSIEELKKYLNLFNDKKTNIINKQNEYLSQLIG